MYKDVLGTLDREVIFALISLMIFFTYFVFLLLDTFRKPKEYISEMEHLPLED